MATVNDISHILSDLVYGEGEHSKHNDFEEATGDQIIKATDLIMSNDNLTPEQKVFFMNNIWRISYKYKPPTMEEFLTPKWIGAVADKMYPHVKEALIKYTDPNRGHRVLALSTCIGFGKFQRLDCKIQTPDGYKLMGDIQVGDIISLPDGNTTDVTHIWPQGKQDLYEFTFKDGRKTIAGLDHLWKVTQGSKNSHKENGNRIYECDYAWYIKSTKELIESGIYRKNGTAPKWKVPLSKPAYHNEKDHYISPYLMGVLLGDGCLCQSSVQVTSNDPLLIERLKDNIPNEYDIHKCKSSDIQYIIKSNKPIKTKPHSLNKELKRLKLKGTKSFTKFIPKDYLYDSIENRINLLQGLMDTDGTVDKKGKIRYDTISYELQQDVIQLVRSLGGVATSYEYKRKDSRYKNILYSIFIQFPNNDFSIFGLKRKQDRVDNNFNRDRFRKGTQNLSIIDIKKIESDNAQCITVNSEEGLYLTDDYIVTHNSTMSAILAVWLIVHLSYMRNPKMYFDQNEMGSLVIALMSFTQLKAKQLLLQPFFNLLKSSPIFHRVMREDRLQPKQDELEPGHIAYTSAGRMGAFQFARDIHITIASNRNDLLGLNIVLGIVSEISFWIRAGISIDEIWGAFSDMRERVNSRFARRYLSGVILDSSPLDLSLSPIDKWIYEGKAEQDPDVMIVTAKHWEVFPDKYPKWKRTGESIPVFRGDAGSPPMVLKTQKDFDKYRPDEILQFPIDLEQSLKNPGEMKKIVADLAGWPAGGIAKLIESKESLDNMFTYTLNNLYSSIDAPEDQNPDKLIWNKVEDLFFIKTGKSWEFYRAPRAPRTLHMDLSESGDMASIAMSHMEMDSKNGYVVVVNDFTIVISPKKSRINLDAICSFIIDLKVKAHINFYKITADQYQSAALLQRLKRYGIDVDKLSVDRDVTPYMVVTSWILNGRTKVGRNIFLRNNFLSLQEVITDKGKKKIDHTVGNIIYEDGGDWDLSLMGVNAKDASDAFTGSAYLLISELEDKVPMYQWTDTHAILDDNALDDGELNVEILNQLAEVFNLQV